MKVLVVDDEPEILSILSTWLTQNGHRVLTTTDPQKALEVAGREELDAVLLDLIMPGSPGINLIPRLRERRPKLPIIVMSAIEDTRVAVLAAQEGIEGYLTKPIDFEKLNEMLVKL
jgi:DNA-binding response OmpR family regulator